MGNLESRNKKFSEHSSQKTKKPQENLPKPSQEDLETKILAEELILPNKKSDLSDSISPISLEHEKKQSSDPIENKKVELNAEISTDPIRNPDGEPSEQIMILQDSIIKKDEEKGEKIGIKSSELIVIEQALSTNQEEPLKKIDSQREETLPQSDKTQPNTEKNLETSNISDFKTEEPAKRDEEMALCFDKVEIKDAETFKSIVEDLINEVVSQPNPIENAIVDVEMQPSIEEISTVLLANQANPLQVEEIKSNNEENTPRLEEPIIKDIEMSPYIEEEVAVKDTEMLGYSEQTFKIEEPKLEINDAENLKLSQNPQEIILKSEEIKSIIPEIPLENEEIKLNPIPEIPLENEEIKLNPIPDEEIKLNPIAETPPENEEIKLNPIPDEEIKLNPIEIPEKNEPISKETPENDLNIIKNPEVNTLNLNQELNETTNITYLQLNSALGCVFGAFIGDALGSAVEFQRTVSPSDLIRALSMNGGIFGNGPGQVTDDSELAMCILNGICESLPSFSSDSIANYYKQWISSRPFDIGNTTRNAFYTLPNLTNNLAKAAQIASRNYNQDSLSNGSFMRSSPLAVYCRHLNTQETEKIVIEDSSMTHSNPIIHQTETMYILCLSHLIQYPKDKEGALKRVFEYAENCNGIAKSWLTDAFDDRKPMPGNPNMGYVKIAFDHSFRELRRNDNDFCETMSRILLLGGDTDTNAAIVGAMIGAYVGYDDLPKDWKDKVEAFGSGVWGIQRPEFLNQRAVKGMVERIFRAAPKVLLLR